MRWSMIAVSALWVASPLVAQHMNAEEFYQRAMKLKSKGPLALFSGGEIRTLTKEGHAAGDVARAQRFAVEKSGRTPRYCPPANLKTIASDEYLNRLGQIPQAQRRRIDMVEATNRIMEMKFPCRR